MWTHVAQQIGQRDDAVSVAIASTTLYLNCIASVCLFA
jgi:hypothetical protein